MTSEVVMRASDKELQEYIAHCASCGQRMKVGPVGHYGDINACHCACPCGREWSMTFDMDSSGTFGVMAFQCDNGDRIQDGIMSQ